MPVLTISSILQSHLAAFCSQALVCWGITPPPTPTPGIKLSRKLSTGSTRSLGGFSSGHQILFGVGRSPQTQQCLHWRLWEESVKGGGGELINKPLFLAGQGLLEAGTLERARGGGWSPELGVARPKRMGGAESARGLSCGEKADARGMLAEVRGWRTVASYFLRPSRLRATLDIPLLSLPRASVAPAFYLVPPPGVAALWEQDSWNAVGTAPHLPGGPPPGPGAHPHPTRSLQPGSPGVTCRGKSQSAVWTLTRGSYGAQSHIPRGGVL